MSVYIGKDKNSADIVANTLTDDFIRKIIIDHYMPQIGTIKLVVRRNKALINGLQMNQNGIYDQKDDSFKGWVYADGSKYSINVFNKAFQKFGYQFGGNDDFFCVPRIDQFVNGKTQQSPLIEIQPCQSKVVDHQHTIETDITHVRGGKILNAITIYQSAVGTDESGGKWVSFLGQWVWQVIDNNGIDNVAAVRSSNFDGKYIQNSDQLKDMMKGTTLYYPVFHQGSGDGNFNATDMIIPKGTDFGDAHVGFYGSTELNCYPDHNIAMAMVYIGV